MLREILKYQDVSFTASDVYQLLMVFSRLDPLKSNIILILAHVAPQKVSGAELTQLLGYSQKARTIYRGVLDELADDGYIIVNKQRNQYSIGIDQNHPLVKRLYELVLTEGTSYTNQLVDKLEEL